MIYLKINNFAGRFTCRCKRGKWIFACNEISINLVKGVNILYGEIDSGGWALTYSFSQNKENFYKRDILIDNNRGFFDILLDDNKKTISEIRKLSCNLELINYRLNGLTSVFSVKQLIEINIKRYSLKCSSEEIRELFGINEQRFNRKLSHVGNEIIECMAAIGYTSNKLIFCFSWLSSIMTDYFMGHILHVFDILTKLGKIVILPTSYNFKDSSKYNFIDMSSLDIKQID